MPFTVPVLTRRQFIYGSALGCAGAISSLRAAEGAFRAVIMGNTGHGDYGHEHIDIFKNRPDIIVAAVSDPDLAGRSKAAARSGAKNQYADFREMLQKERPDLAVIAPRWTDRHFEMASAALDARAHIYSEKPFTTTLTEADEILARAKQLKRKVVVAHQIRLAPNFVAFVKAVQNGLIGEIIEIQLHGKQDSRAGGEDLIVLGTHLLDLLRALAGDAAWCSASVRAHGSEVTKADIAKPTEAIGPVIGDEIEAQLEMKNGVHATFTSRAKLRQTLGPWGIELLGSKGRAHILVEIYPTIYISTERQWAERGGTSEWRLWEHPTNADVPREIRGFKHANARVVDDWLAAIEDDREPVCSGYNAMKAVELAHAVFAAGLQKTRVPLPLANRAHPLS